MNRRRLSIVWLAAILVVLNVALNWFLFLPGESLYRDSIEGGYASMARFFHDNPSIWGWNPEWYLGLPAQFTYLPGLPYLSALVMHLLPWLEPYHVYRLVSTTIACLVPASFFFLVLYFTGSRVWAFTVAIAYTFSSPLYDLIDVLNRDRGFAYLPWRLQVLRKYGEGPHNAGLFLLPLVIITAWRAGITSGFGPVFLAAVLMAAVTLTNWVAALALSFCGLLLLLAAAGKPDFRHSRVIGAGALGYGFACFWLTPTFVYTTAFNWPTDAFKFTRSDVQDLVLIGLIAGVLLIRAGMHYVAREQRYLSFLLMGLFTFAWIVLWFYEANIPVIPEARRYALEFEIFFFLAAAELLRLGFRSPLRRDQGIACVILLMMVWQNQKYVRRYLTQSSDRLKPVPLESTIEYRLARKLSELQPNGRVFATGGLRFRMNSWFPFQQVGGGFESGLRNRHPLSLDYQVRTGANSRPGEAPQDAVNELKAIAVEYVVVHGPKSREHYRDVKDPLKFEGLLEPVHREEDDVIYRVADAPFARLVRYDELIEWPGNSPIALVGPYVRSATDAARPKLRTKWLNASQFEVEGPMLQGLLLSVPVSYDSGWTATQDGRPLTVHSDNFKFLMVEPSGSAFSRVRFVYRGTPEQRAMFLLSAITWIGALLALRRERRVKAALAKP